MSDANAVEATQTGSNLHELFEGLLDQALQENGTSPPLREWVDLAESWRILHALRTARGNRSEAARQLGIGRRTLYTKMDKLGIEARFSVRGEG